MRAVGLLDFGGPEKLEILELPMPVVGPDQIRLRVHAATVNPTDVGLRAGTRAGLRPDQPGPHVPGMEIAGFVHAVGTRAATDLAVGDQAIAIVRPEGAHGGYAEYVVVPAASVARAPEGATHVEAATLPMNGLTAMLSLERLDLRRGDWLGVTGAAGGVGGYVIQLAKALGLHVIADAAPHDEDLVGDLGADVVVPRGQGVAAAMREVRPDGVRGLVDAAVLDEAVESAVATGGAVATLRRFTGPRGSQVSWHPVMVGEQALEHEKLSRLSCLVGQGLLTLRIGKVLPAELASEAHRALEAGGIRGRIVLEF